MNLSDDLTVVLKLQETLTRYLSLAFDRYHDKLGRRAAILRVGIIEALLRRAADEQYVYQNLFYIYGVSHLEFLEAWREIEALNNGAEGSDKSQRFRR